MSDKYPDILRQDNWPKVREGVYSGKSLQLTVLQLTGLQLTTAASGKPVSSLENY